MNFFKNTELAKKYSISESTVRNWIKLARAGKLQLELIENQGRVYVANSANNILTIERLVTNNKKYRNSLSAKAVTPRPEFYKIFTQGQIYDIVRNLELHHEIPRQYNYFDSGANAWDKYVNTLAAETSQNYFHATNELLFSLIRLLDKRLSSYDQINIVDIGVGNARPAKDLLLYLQGKNRLGRYIAIDISDSMLRVAERNIKSWFGEEILFEGYQMDVTFERFANVLAEDYLKNDTRTLNLVLVLGGTPSNFRQPNDAFRTINESLNPSDLMIYIERLDTQKRNPEWLKHDAKPGTHTLTARHRLVFDLLNINPELYDVEIGFDQEKHQNYARTRFKVALTLEFHFEDGTRMVTFEKGETILLWRSWQMDVNNVLDRLDRTNFYTLHTSQSPDHQYIMTVAEVKRDQ